MVGQTEETKIAVISNDISYMKLRLDEISEKLNDFATNYLTRSEFELWKKGEYSIVRNIVFSTAGTILTVVLGSILFLTFKK